MIFFLFGLLLQKLPVGGGGGGLEDSLVNATCKEADLKSNNFYSQDNKEQHISQNTLCG